VAQFAKGDQVIDRRTSEVGVVLRVELASRSPLYRIQFATGSRYIAGEQLEAATLDPLDRLRERSLGHPHPYHLRLRALLLEHAYRNDRYSGLTNARIEPKAHQVSVAFRALEKVRPRLLLADEVGLGKTIETALILKELLARRIVQRILVICPASLLTQWEQELRSKFNEQFTLVDSLTLHYLQKQGHANPFLGVDKAICSIHLARSRGKAEQIVEAGWDVVVVDEAHHLAPRPNKNKLYGLVEQLSTSVFGLLLLTATPIQLRAMELFHLMELVEPGTFTDLRQFESRRTTIPKLNALWKALDDWPALADKDRRETIDAHRQLLKTAVATPDGDFVRALDDEQARRSVQRSLEDRHPYLNVMVRNRKNVLGIGVRREADLVRCRQSDLEAETYEAVTEYLRDQYDMAIGSKNNARGFLMVTYLKILSSSTYALAQSFRRRVERLTQPKKAAKPKPIDQESLRDLADADEVLEELEPAAAAVEEEVLVLRELIARLSRVEDTKASNLLLSLKRIFHANPDQKVLIFTQSLDTQEFLRRKLAPAYNVGVFNGRMSVSEKDQAVALFRDRGQILISSESGGEGRNFQFCHILVNYDLPWNPMRVEQRIGRLDRIGQQHVVRIQNLGNPPVDRRLVTLGGATPGALHGPAQPVTQQCPHVRGVVAHAGQPPDHQRDPLRVHSSPTNPLAVGPLSSTCSTSASCWSDSRGAGPLGPLLRSPSVPLALKRRCQTLTAWAETPSWRAASAWWTPAASSSAARSRRASSRSRCCCAAARRGTVGMPPILTRRATQRQHALRVPQPNTQGPF
jgi:superfamily II DNA or RNA helicase